MSDRDEWARRVAGWKASGEPSTTFCMGQGFSASALRYWAKCLEREQPAARPRPMRIAQLVRGPSSSTLTLDAAAGPIVVEAGGVRILVERADGAALRTVLEVLADLGRSGTAR